MFGKIKHGFITLACTLVCLVAATAVAACSGTSPNDLAYWFSESKLDTFVAYDEDANNGEGNLNEAGTYWEFTVKSDCSVTISFRTSGGGLTSYEKLYVNGAEKEASKNGDSAFGNSYELSLKKGDKLKYRAYWLYGADDDDTPFELTLMMITHNGNTYPLIDKL